ncbi:U-scoloptoxin(01)-Cw1a-like [Homarus americanus]|uniref:U-scoloptoxin(01)-Cw1a-like 10 n=1 Tax=Homarus americanus TaxID=6706 RepID=A0A8J5JK23_HOMAM|nr:U-scoloptoxin(01)-Cw1a-like [Homarus americanus]KAG7157379.1 U-scoloptoxin(01)-Cw1a-like 10 [Homarus americanus]
MQVVLVLVTVVAAASARMAGIVAGGFSIQPGFSCEGREYGYYADVENDCKAYHICQPFLNDVDQLMELAHFTFMCGQDTIFNQEQLDCSQPNIAFPCAEAASIYDSSNLQLRIEPEPKEKPVVV